MKLNNCVKSPSLLSKKSFQKQLHNIRHNLAQIRLPLCRNKNKIVESPCAPLDSASSLFKLRKIVSNPQAQVNQEKNNRYDFTQKNHLLQKSRKTSLKTSQILIKNSDQIKYKTQHSELDDRSQSFRAKFCKNRKKIAQDSFLRAVSDENQMCEQILKMRRRVISYHNIDTLEDQESEMSTKKTIINYNRFLSIGCKKNQLGYSLTSQQKIVQLKQILGTGANAQVKLGECQGGQKMKLVIKIFDKQKLFTKQKRNRVYSEIKILEEITRHQNIISFIQAFQNKKQIHILFEYVEQVESLKDFFRKKNYFLNQKQQKTILFKVAKGLNHLHSIGISHRDLKPANIIIGLGQGGEQVVKIIDFGVATNKQKSDAHCGTPNFMAPEIINSKNQDFDMKCGDVWAFGVMAFYLSEGRLPFKGKNQMDLYINIKQGEFGFSRTQSKDLKQLIQQCLELDASKRIKASQVLHHPWFFSR